MCVCVCVSRYRGTKINGNKELSCSELMQFEYCKGPHMRSRMSHNFSSYGNLEAKLSYGSAWFETEFLSVPPLALSNSRHKRTYIWNILRFHLGGQAPKFPLEVKFRNIPLRSSVLSLRLLCCIFTSPDAA